MWYIAVEWIVIHIVHTQMMTGRVEQFPAVWKRNLELFGPPTCEQAINRGLRLSRLVCWDGFKKGTIQKIWPHLCWEIGTTVTNYRIYSIWHCQFWIQKSFRIQKRVICPGSNHQLAAVRLTMSWNQTHFVTLCNVKSWNGHAKTGAAYQPKKTAYPPDLVALDCEAKPLLVDAQGNHSIG